jgi:hypothetical protein
VVVVVVVVVQYLWKKAKKLRMFTEISTPPQC